MSSAGSQRFARRTSPPIPFPMLLGALLIVLASAVFFRWPRTEASKETVVSERRVGAPRQGKTAPPRCTYGDVPTRSREYADWTRTLLDTTFALPRSYSPPDLATTDRAGFDGPFLVRSFVLDDLAALRSAAEAAGAPLELAAAYRSHAQQADLFDRREATLGRTGALEGTARPGHSEHQLGTAVDFKERGAADVTAAWGRSSAGRWMRANAHRFGFVLSYPEGRDAVTCYKYEPWHFRYFGRGLAQRIHRSGLTVREYLWSVRQRASNN